MSLQSQLMHPTAAKLARVILVKLHMGHWPKVQGSKHYSLSQTGQEIGQNNPVLPKTEKVMIVTVYVWCGTR